MSTTVTRGGQPRERSILFNEVFGNVMVWKITASHLNISELKTVRQTCKLFLKSINSTPKFRDSLNLIISKKSIEEGVLKYGTGIDWKRGTVYPQDINLSIYIKDVLKKAQHLTLFGSKENINAEPNHLQILSGLKLKSLTLDFGLLRHPLYFDEYSATLEKLEDLKIILQQNVTYPYPDDEFDKSVFENLINNMTKLSSSCLNLKSLELTERFGEGDKKSPWLTVTLGHNKGYKLDDIIRRMFEANKNTLRKLVIPIIAGVEKIKFPSLEIIDLNFINADGLKCTEFLNNQKPLKNIILKNHWGGSTLIQPNTYELLIAITKHTSKLQELTLTGLNIGAKITENWYGFFNQFFIEKKLLKIHICGRKWWIFNRDEDDLTDFKNLSEAFEILPESLKEISIVGVGFKNVEENDIVTFERFPKLRKLDIRGPLNCEKLESICKNFV